MPDPRFANVQWLFFDWGGVLKDEFEIYREIARSATEYLSSKEIVIDQQRLYDKLIELERADQQIRLPKALRDQSVPAELIDETTTSAEAAPALLAQTPYEGVAETLALLRKKYGLGVITNGRKIEAVLEREGIAQFFQIMIGSQEFGYLKPDPKIFEGALSQADCTASDAIMIGDRLNKDIAGAKAVGMRTIRIRQGIYADQEPATPDEHPDAEITDIRQLTELLL